MTAYNRADAVVSAMQELYRFRVLHAGGFLTNDITRLFLERCSRRNSGIQYQVMPMRAVICKKRGQMLLGIICVLFLACFAKNVVDISNLGTQRYQTLRLRTETTNLGLWYDLSFGVLLSGCEGIATRNITHSHSYIDCVYQNAVKFDGWYLDVGMGGDFPPQFRLEGSNDYINWETVGASSKSYRYTSNLRMEWIFSDGVPISNANECSTNCIRARRNPSFESKCCMVDGRKRIVFDHRWTWPMLLPCFLNIIGAGACFVAIVHGRVHPYARDVMWIVRSTLWALTMTYAAFTLLWGVLPDSTGSVDSQQIALPLIMTLSTSSVLALAYVVKEQHIPDIFLILGLQIMFAQVIDLVVISGASPTPVQVFLTALTPCILLLIGAVFKVSAWANLASARARFRGYEASRNRAMSALDGLDRIEDIIKHIRYPSSVASGAKQDHRLSSKSFWADLQEHALLTQTGAGALVGGLCLDRLQAQSLLLQPFLDAKTSAWAADVGAESCLAVAGGEGAVEDARRGAKAMERLAEKFACSLDPEPPCQFEMFDLCRQRLVFEDAEHLLQGFLALGRDPNIRIVGATNNMAPGALRDAPVYHVCVSLYLHILTQDTVRLGIAGHVCEIQLMLRCLEDLQDRLAHEAYTDYRSAFDCHAFSLARAVRTALRAFLSNTVERVHSSSEPMSLLGVETVSAAAASTASLLAEGEDWLLSACLACCVLPGDYLSSQLPRTYVAMSRASPSSALFTSTPLAAAMSKPVFRAIVFSIGLTALFACGMTMYSYDTLGSIEYQHYRCRLRLCARRNARLACLATDDFVGG
jgi:hypothetical protein